MFKEDDFDRMGIEIACRRLSVAFATRVDQNDVDGVAALFLPDGRFSRADMTLDGAEAIRIFLRDRPAQRITRHVCTNILIDVDDPERARGLTYFTLYEGTRPEELSGSPLPVQLPHTIGEYHDVFRKTKDGWRIFERRSTAIFRRK